MMTFNKAALGLIAALMLAGPVQAEEASKKSPMDGVKLGFGDDLGFGIMGSMGAFNGFLGNDGVAIDYIFTKGDFKMKEPLSWFIGGGGFIGFNDLEDSFGARLPVGFQFNFAKRFDAFAQVIPTFAVYDHPISGTESEFDLEFGIGVRYQF